MFSFVIQNIVNKREKVVQFSYSILSIFELNLPFLILFVNYMIIIDFEEITNFLYF